MPAPGSAMQRAPTQQIMDSVDSLIKIMLPNHGLSPTAGAICGGAARGHNAQARRPAAELRAC